MVEKGESEIKNKEREREKRERKREEKERRGREREREREREGERKLKVIMGSFLLYFDHKQRSHQTCLVLLQGSNHVDPTSQSTSHRKKPLPTNANTKAEKNY